MRAGLARKCGNEEFQEKTLKINDQMYVETEKLNRKLNPTQLMIVLKKLSFRNELFARNRFTLLSDNMLHAC